MIAVGMNLSSTPRAYSTVGMLSVGIGAVANLLLDPLFIFVLGFGVQGTAIATVLSQCLSAVFVLFFLTKKSELKIRFIGKTRFPPVWPSEEYRQPGNCQFHHAADQQPGNDLLQQRALQYRRRYLYLRHDDRFQRASAGGNADLCDE